MELNIKNFFIMNQVFVLFTGFMLQKLISSTMINKELIVSLAGLLIGLVGFYVSFKGLFLLFSRNYKKVNE